MEATGSVPDEDGPTEEGVGKQDLCLDFRYASSDRQRPQKLIRTATFPFRMLSRPTTTAADAASNGKAGSPLSRRLSPNRGVFGGGGAAAVLCHSAVSDLGGAPRTLQQFVSPLKYPGIADDSTLPLRSPFTAAQWQELHRQALVFKYIMGSVPVPPELVCVPRTLPDGHPLFSNCAPRTLPDVCGGGDYLNLRFTGNTVDPEPGRCRRTDGKKWRCSREVAPGQKYCERHMHRARPRSRKPVELDKRAGAPAAGNGASAASTSSAGIRRASPTTTTGPPPFPARASTQSSTVLLPDSDLKFPFQFMAPQGHRLRYVGSGGADAEAQASIQQWQELHSKMGLGISNSVVLQQQQREDQLNLNYTILNDQRGYPVLSIDIPSVGDDAPEHGPPGAPPRRFIDALSRESLFGATICDDKLQPHKVDGCSNSFVPSSGSLSPSNLSLCMSALRGADDGRDQMRVGGLGTSYSVLKTPAPSWTNPVIGGPLAEALQSSSGASFQNERTGGGSDVTGACTGLIDLMSKTHGGNCEVASPRDSITPPPFSSPTGVLQKNLVSLSDSSGNSSPTFGPQPRPELGLQWVNQSN